MPSSHLRYVEPGVEPAYVPLSHTVSEPPFAACSVAPLPACAAKAAPATSSAAQTSVTRPRLELFIVSPPSRAGPPLSRGNRGEGSVDCVRCTCDVGGVVRAQKHDELADLARQPESMRRHGLEDARLVDRSTRGVPVP